MEQLHNQYVSEGWEGVVIRDPSKLYRPNGRTNDMIKIKHYQDSTFLVVGYELGLRGSEDMVFNCQLPDGRLFKAKPYGDRLCKQEYVENFEEKYLNQLGDCKFFYYSNDGIPLQPSFIAFRYDLNKSDLGYN
jgi:DNA ligase-1